MKKLLLLSMMFICLSEMASAQIDTTHGIYPVDSCHFELPCDWIILSPDSPHVWQIGAVQKPGFDSTYSPPNALVTDTLFPYPVSVNSCVELDLDLVPLASSNLILSFKHRYETDSLIDGGFIEISYDAGQSWQNVLLDDAMYVGYENLYTETDTLAGGGYGFSGNSAVWTTTRIQWIWSMLTRGTGNGIKLRFCFKSDAIQMNKAGWIIDDIMISISEDMGNVADHHVFDALTIFPNPAVNQLNMQFTPGDSKIYTLTILNVLGQQIKVKIPLPSGTSCLDIADLPAGMYTIQIQDGLKVLGHKRFIKQ